METQQKNKNKLERIVEATRLYGKQWIPVYGLYQAIKDYDQGNPAMGDVVHTINTVYHGLFLSAIPVVPLLLYLHYHY